jgi:hypothetical protein
MSDTFQGLLEAVSVPNQSVNKERLVNVIKTNTDLLKQSLSKLGELSKIEGGNTWLMLPPGGINSHPSLTAAVSSIEDPVSVIDHSMQGTAEDLASTRWLEETAARSEFVKICFEGKGNGLLSGTKKRRLDFVAQDIISELDYTLEQVTSKDPLIKVKTVGDPHLPTAVSFSYIQVFQGQFIFGPSPNGAVSIERIEIRGADENEPGRSHHYVFEAIAAQALAAHDHYVRHQPGAVLLRMLLWVAAYGRLFAAECVGCGRMLYLDTSRTSAADGPVFLPPTLRTYTTLQPYHPQCCKKKDS